MQTLRLFGITGGIGSGKSTVARILRELGLPVIDADQLARQAVEPGQPAHAEIARAWPQVIADGGRIDRQKLAVVVFADPQARTQLESITHPRILDLARVQADELARQGHRLAFLEAALLVETGLHKTLAGLVVVTAGEGQQVDRVVARDRTTPELARERLRAQVSDEERRRVATHIVDNSGDVESTRRQVAAMVQEILQKTPESGSHER